MYINMLGYLDALFITNPANIRYLTGFVGVAGKEREAYLLLLKNYAFLFTSGLYREQAQKQLLHCYIATWLKKPVQLIEISKEKPISKRLKEIFVSISLNRNTKVGFEEDDLKVAEYDTILKRVQDDNRKFDVIATKNRIEKLRMIKREDEIENIREAARLTDECFTYIIGKLKTGLPADLSAVALTKVEALAKAGVTESEIAWEIESFIRKSGAELSFSPIVAFGKNTSQPHYNTFSFARPGLAKLNLNSLSERPQSNQGLALKSNDIILLDFGARVNGYCADMTRVVFANKPKDEWKRAYDTVLKAQQRAIAYFNRLHPRGVPQAQHHLRGGRSGAQADRIARDVIKDAVFPPYPHSLGHGVGLDIHESPRLTVKKDVQLKPGMVFSVEPGIYFEGEYGVRIEDLILLKEDGVEILSKTDKSLKIL